MLFTFYSYKGGVGRTFLMANIAVLLARWGHKVLCVDWDLEAPGLHHYFAEWVSSEPDRGLVEWIADFARDAPSSWRASTIAVDRLDLPGSVAFMPAGRLDETYPNRMRQLFWEDLYAERDLGSYLEEFRAEALAEYDFVLVDSRTGITDASGICTAQLPDVLVLCYTSNKQSLQGITEVARRAVTARNQLPYGRGGLLTLPVLSRFDGREEYRKASEWREIASVQLRQIYDQWVPTSTTPLDLIERTTVPYLPIWSYGEEVPARDERTSNPELVTYPLEAIASLLVHGLSEVPALLDARERYVDNSRAVSQRSLTREKAEYLRHVRARYHGMDLEVLAPESEQDELPVLSLWDTFIEQVVRAGPRPTEVPRELLQRPIGTGLTEARDLPGGITRSALHRIRDSYQQQPSVPVLSLIAGSDGARLVLLGDPGSGKSTLARYIAYTLSFAEVAGSLEPLAGWLPVVIELREYALHGGAIIDFLDQLRQREGLSPSRELLQQHLDGDGKIVFIFDGLDEILDPPGRDQAAKHIAAMAARYPGVRIIVTSRVIDYQKNVLEAAGFRRYQLQDFGHAQIAAFVDRWCDVAYPRDPSAAANSGRQLMAAINDTPAVAELAGNPMLLTILAIVGRRRSLPHHRAGVYAHAINVLVEQWDPHKFLPTFELETNDQYLDARDKVAILRLVARAMQEGPAGLAGNFVSGQHLQQVLSAFLQERDPGLSAAQARRAADVIVQQFRRRNFLLSSFGDDGYGFVHRSFLEYLAADDLAHRFNVERSISESDLVDGVFGRRWRDPAWHEVLLLTAGMLDERFVNRAVIRLLGADPHWAASNLLEPHHVFLAIRCIGEKRRITPLIEACKLAVDEVIRILRAAHRRVAQAGDDALAQEIERSVMPVFAVIGRWPGRENYLVWYTGNGLIETDGPATADLAARLAVILLGDSAKLLAFLRRQASHGWSVFQRMAAVSALTRMVLGLPEVMPLVRDRLATDPDHEVRLRALLEVCRVQSEDPETLALLRERATMDRHDSVRRAAVQAIGSHWPDDPQVPALLRALLADQRHSEVRVAAAEALVNHPGDETESWSLLRMVATVDSDGDVRLAAMQSMATLWPELPGTRELLLDRITDDSSLHVRQAAIDAAARGWSDRPEILSMLHHLAVSEPQDRIRQAAVRAIADTRPDDPRTPALLVDRIRQDPSREVRETAVQALARGWPGKPELLPVLRKQAASDTSGEVRRAAVTAVGACWSGAPGILDWLRTRAMPGTERSEGVRLAAIRQIVAGRHDQQYIERWLHIRGAEDPSADVRKAVVEAVATAWNDDADTLLWLRQRAAEDWDEQVRDTAVRAIASGWPTDPGTLPLLRHLAAGDDAVRVRLTAIEALTAGWHGRDDALPFLIDRARHDPHGDVRRAAASAVAAGWPDEAMTLILLHERAQDDPHESVRRAAIRAVAQGWHDDPDTLALLRTRATADPHGEVRLAAVEALAAGWPDNETLRMLQERAEDDPHPGVRILSINAIINDRHPGDRILPLLQARLAADADSDVRQALVRVLADNWHDDPTTRALLELQAVEDPDDAVRRAARTVLAELANRAHRAG